MYEEVLLDIGFTQSEVAIYLALLDLGSSTTGPLIKKSRIASGKAYLILDKLMQKGMVTSVIRSGTKHYHAKDPLHLLEYLKEQERTIQVKEEAVKRILPSLQEKYEEHKSEVLAEVFEGVKGFRTFYEWTLKELKRGDCIDILGVPKEAHERMGAFLLDWNKRRISLGISMRIMYNHECRTVGKSRERMRLTQVRYMKPELETPAWIDIFKEYVVTINVHHTPVCFLIRSKESADSYKKYFNILWRLSAE